MRPQKIVTVYGTRPEGIKMAPVLRRLERTPKVESIPVTTGQHREMLSQVHRIFGIEPAYDLGLMTRGQILNGLIARVISGVDELFERIRPELGPR